MKTTATSRPSMVLIERMRIVFAAIMAGGFLLATRISGAGVRCEELRLKPLKCVCGTLIDRVGDVIPEATVTIVKNGTEIATVQTGADGKFSFDGLKAASYDLRARWVRFPVVG